MRIFMALQKQLDAVIDTIDPRKGNGALESAVVIILIAAYVYFINSGIQIPEEFRGFITLIIGYLFGRNEK